VRLTEIDDDGGIDAVSIESHTEVTE